MKTVPWTGEWDLQTNRKQLLNKGWAQLQGLLPKSGIEINMAGIAGKLPSRSWEGESRVVGCPSPLDPPYRHPPTTFVEMIYVGNSPRSVVPTILSILDNAILIKETLSPLWRKIFKKDTRNR